VKFFNHLFGKNKKNKDDHEQSPFLSKESDPKEIQFAKNYTIKGGKFIFCENKTEVLYYFNQILLENGWEEKDLSCNNKLLNEYFQIKINNENNITNVEVLSCEFLIANKGSILLCKKQLDTRKLDEIPENLVIIAQNNQFVSDLSEAMTRLNSKYTNIPTNISTINAFDPNSEIDFLSYGSTSKNVYLLVQEK
tara:strand:+ start:1871 stop:2452 length:582 start_codon:yes stop_codon:yes gene_type:complete